MSDYSDPSKNARVIGYYAGAMKNIRQVMESLLEEPYTPKHHRNAYKVILRACHNAQCYETQELGKLSLPPISDVREHPRNVVPLTNRDHDVTDSPGA